MTEALNDLLLERAPRALRKEFTVTIEDAVKSQLILALQRTSLRIQLRATLFGWAMFSAVMYYQVGEIDYRIPVALLLGLPFPLLFFAFLKCAPRLAYRAHYTTHFGPGPYQALVEIGETQMIDRFGDLEVRYPWHAVRKLENHAGDLCIFVGRFALTRIPGRVFDDENEKRQWMTALEQKTGLSFS
jgi:hypothetical protein